jgi:hypothetical protein
LTKVILFKTRKYKAMMMAKKIKYKAIFAFQEKSACPSW